MNLDYIGPVLEHQPCCCADDRRDRMADFHLAMMYISMVSGRHGGTGEMLPRVPALFRFRTASLLIG